MVNLPVGNYRTALYYRTSPASPWSAYDFGNGTFAVTSTHPSPSPSPRLTAGRATPTAAAQTASWSLNTPVSAGRFFAWVVDPAGNWLPNTIFRVNAVSGQTLYTQPWVVNLPVGNYRTALYYRTSPTSPWSAYDSGNGTFAVTP